MGLRTTLRELFGRGDRQLVELLIAHIEAVAAGAEAIRAAVRGHMSGTELEVRVRDIEHEGDDRRTELIAHMARSVVLPLDREDVHRLSRSIDDILDCLRDFSEEWSLYGMSADPLYEPLVDELIEALDELTAAASLLTEEPHAIARAALAIKKGATEVRRAHQRARSTLFDRADVVSGLVLKHRELLRRLDVVALKLSDTADVLSDAAVKRNL
jgi:uncharacterized protein